MELDMERDEYEKGGQGERGRLEPYEVLVKCTSHSEDAAVNLSIDPVTSANAEGLHRQNAQYSKRK
jgi:hypothetical protein